MEQACPACFRFAIEVATEPQFPEVLVPEACIACVPVYVPELAAQHQSPEVLVGQAVLPVSGLRS